MRSDVNTEDIARENHQAGFRTLCVAVVAAVCMLPQAATPGERYLRWDRLEAAAVPYLKLNGITHVLEAESAPSEFRAACEQAGIRLVPGAAAPGVHLVREGTWPGLNPMVQMGPGSDKAKSGATSGPWIDANGWLIQYHRASSDGPLLIAYDPPKDARLRPGSLELSVAEAAAVGARFAIRLDDRLRNGLSAGQPRAVAEWKRVGEQLAFCERPVFEGTPAANIAVVVDQLEPVAEVLNLLARRNLPFVVLRRDRLSRESVEQCRLVIAIGQPPLPRLQTALIERKQVIDPEDFVAQVGKRMSGRRLYTLDNADTIISYPARLRDGRLAVHLVNYAIDPLRDVRLRVAGKFSRAELFLPDKAAAQQLAIKAGEVVIPDMEVSAVLVLTPAAAPASAGQRPGAAGR